MGEGSVSAGVAVFACMLALVGSGLLWATHTQGHDAVVAGSQDPAGAPPEVTIRMKDLAYLPDAITVPVGTKVTWVNDDPFAHTVTPVDKGQWGSDGSGDAPADWMEQGARYSHTFDEAGTYVYFCIPHAAKGADGAYRGMVATIRVEAGAAPPSGSGVPEQPDGAAQPGPARGVDVAEIAADAAAVPGPTGRNAPAHVTFDLTSSEVTAEMADGTTYTYWTFDNQVPGPMLRVREGDTVTVRHHNDASSTMGHNIDFHAVTGPGGGAHALDALPGETAVFTFKALNAGLFVYHCAYQDPPLHVAHGMYGMILVEPAEGLAPVDKEFYVVQGDFYSPFAAGQQGHHPYDGERAADEEPSFVVFNGRMGALTGEGALQAEVGDSVRIYVGNGGPNMVSSFHIIGEIFDRAYDQGSLTTPPQANVQTTLIPAGGSAMVEFDVEYPGDYYLVDHSIFRVHKGAFGVLHVEGEADPAVFRSGE